jgi:pimeloyl-ACP methyl ester carboxylesterase
VTVLYRVPMTAQQGPTPGADNVLLDCLWPGGAEPKPGHPLLAHMKPFSDQLGFTVFSIEIKTDRARLDDKREVYFQGGPDWVDLVQRAHEEIIKRHHLKRRKLLLYGESLGGTFAERLAVAMPDKVAGVVIQNAPEVTLPEVRANTAWFVNVTRGDQGARANAELVQKLRDLDTPCIHAIAPPSYIERGKANFYHSVSPAAFHANLMYLKGLVEQRGARTENDPARWPYVRDNAKSLMIRRNERQISAQIPESRREYMPSREFVHALQAMPAPMQTVVLDSRDPAHSLCMVGLPPLGVPKGAIIVCHKYGFLDLAELLNNINFLAGKDYVVFAPKLGDQPDLALARTLNFLNRNRALAGLPLSFIGVGEDNKALWKLLLTRRNLRPAAHVPIDFRSSDLLDQSNWPLGIRPEWPMLFLYDEKNLAMAQDKQLQNVQHFVETMKRRNKVAAVRILVPGRNSDKDSSQKRIETAFQFIDASVGGRLRKEF